MPEGHVSTQRYARNVNSVPNIEKTLTIERIGLRENGNSNNQDSNVFRFSCRITSLAL